MLNRFFNALRVQINYKGKYGNTISHIFLQTLSYKDNKLPVKVYLPSEHIFKSRFFSYSTDDLEDVNHKTGNRSLSKITKINYGETFSTTLIITS